MRRFVVIGRIATASPDFSLVDVAGTSGRLDVLLRCLRAALLVSHGLRHDTIVYLVLLGGPRAPRTLRVDGSIVRFVRPDERSLAVLVQKALAADLHGDGFVQVRRGLDVAEGGLPAVLADVAAAAGDAKPSFYVLDERAADVRGVDLDVDAPVFVVGDHLGLEDEARAHVDALGAVAVSLGPVSVHADDAITLVANEVDRRAAGATLTRRSDE